MSLPRPVRYVARGLLPSLAAERARNYEGRFREELGVTAAARSFFDQHGNKVLAGPFAAMTLGADFVEQNCSALKLLGLYEPQLQQSLEEVLRTSPRQIVNLGCAEGYYAVGLALRAPQANVYAYDLAESARAATVALAKRNAVSDRVIVNKRCRALSRLTPDFLLCDIEGGEYRFFSKTVIQELRHAFVVIEVHGDPDELGRRFALSHNIEVLERSLPAADVALFAGFSAGERELLLDELRGDEQYWLVARPQFAARPQP